MLSFNIDIIPISLKIYQGGGHLEILKHDTTICTRLRYGVYTYSDWGMGVFTFICQPFECGPLPVKSHTPSMPDQVWREGSIAWVFVSRSARASPTQPGDEGIRDSPGVYLHRA